MTDNMNGGTHLALGTISTLAGFGIVHVTTDIPIEPATIWIALGMAAVGSLAPDIDHPRATISRGIPRELLKSGRGLFLIIALLAIFPALSGVLRGGNLLEAAKNGYNNSPIAQMFLPIAASILLVSLALHLTSVVVSGLFGHRGATHSLLIAACATGLAIAGSMFIAIAWWFGLFFGWGYFTHLLADALTETGLPALFWPLRFYL